MNVIVKKLLKAQILLAAKINHLKTFRGQIKQKLSSHNLLHRQLLGSK